MGKGRGPAKNEAHEQFEEGPNPGGAPAAIVRPRGSHHHHMGGHPAAAESGGESMSNGTARGEAQMAPAAPIRPMPPAGSGDGRGGPSVIVSEDGSLNLKALKSAKITELAHIARDYNIDGATNMRKQE